jgi:hypothetical protein
MWQASFFDRALRKHEDLETVARYIFNNPVEAGLVQRAADYPFTGASAGWAEELLRAMEPSGEQLKRLAYISSIPHDEA